MLVPTIRIEVETVLVGSLNLTGDFPPALLASPTPTPVPGVGVGECPFPAALALDPKALNLLFSLLPPCSSSLDAGVSLDFRIPFTGEVELELDG